eukprot:scaffold283491_cov17-Tisochrysis_lutea.AAC.1
MFLVLGQAQHAFYREPSTPLQSSLRIAYPHIRQQRNHASTRPCHKHSKCVPVRAAVYFRLGGGGDIIGKRNILLWQGLCRYECKAGLLG